MQHCSCGKGSFCGYKDFSPILRNSIHWKGYSKERHTEHNFWFCVNGLSEPGQASVFSWASVSIFKTEVKGFHVSLSIFSLLAFFYQYLKINYPIPLFHLPPVLQGVSLASRCLASSKTCLHLFWSFLSVLLVSLSNAWTTQGCLLKHLKYTGTFHLGCSRELHFWLLTSLLSTTPCASVPTVACPCSPDMSLVLFSSHSAHGMLCLFLSSPKLVGLNYSLNQWLFVLWGFLGKSDKSHEPFLH